MMIGEEEARHRILEMVSALDGRTVTLADALDCFAAQNYDSNSALLSALLQRCGANTKSVEHCGDDRDSLAKAIKRGIKNNVLIISGGVSVGEHDLVKKALCDLGAK